MLRIDIFTRKSLGILSIVLLSFVWSARSEAHVLLETPQAVQGTAYKAVFRVPHGCHGLPTTALKIDIPDGIAGAKPMPKPGWTLSLTKGQKGANSVTWSGGSLPDDEYDEFVVMTHVSVTLAPGATVYFPAVQTCGDETESWTEILQPGQAMGDLKHPAASLHILAAAGMPPSIITAGSLTIATPWLRATPNGAKVAGGYLSITNKGSESDRLISATLPVAPKGAIHEMSMDNGMMRMNELPDGLEIKPGETVILKPGSYHIMFEDLSEPLKQGDMVEGTLTFAKAGKVNVTFKVGGIGEQAPPQGDAGGMDHMHMH